jgi:hypothetical protein
MAVAVMPAAIAPTADKQPDWDVEREGASLAKRHDATGTQTNALNGVDAVSGVGEVGATGTSAELITSSSDIVGTDCGMLNAQQHRKTGLGRALARLHEQR